MILGDRFIIDPKFRLCVLLRRWRFRSRAKLLAVSPKSFHYTISLYLAEKQVVVMIQSSNEVVLENVA